MTAEHGCKWIACNIIVTGNHLFKRLVMVL